eukprot:UN28127
MITLFFKDLTLKCERDVINLENRHTEEKNIWRMNLNRKKKIGKNRCLLFWSFQSSKFVHVNQILP